MLGCLEATDLFRDGLDPDRGVRPKMLRGYGVMGKSEVPGRSKDRGSSQLSPADQFAIVSGRLFDRSSEDLVGFGIPSEGEGEVSEKKPPTES